MKNKVRRSKRLAKGTRKKYRCPLCHKKASKLHVCGGKTKEMKRAEKWKQKK